MQIVKYAPAFKADCIAIFKSNLPKFFAAEELEFFENFLDHVIDGHYYVAKIDDLLIGCGGIFFDKNNDEAGLAWGMVDVKYHKQGIGKLLTQFRIDLLKEMYPEKKIKIETSQHTAEFYKKNGFHIVDILPDGFGTGIDKYTMQMEFRR
ncbi:MULTISPECIES: GNAT family N-acetyltransferase [Sphingobacterium]|uniref:GNAT family N-acetyltransferase n=1 Tax=Sphingobacterium TaxID=28453 RepID=UPI00257DB988|nr:MULTISPECIES: GNAT family N-acetyltransferase [Sphingobacterium]